MFGYYILLGFIPLFQLFCGIHAFKTGRTSWIWIILFFPGVGGLLYFIIEIFPEFRSGADQVVTNAENVIVPQAELNRLEVELEVCDNVTNRLALADAHIQNNQCKEALDLLEQYNAGPYVDDSDVQSQLALSYYLNKNYEKAHESLLRIKKSDGRFEKQEYHLLFAMTLEKLGNQEKTIQEYTSLEQNFIGEEARYKYAIFLRNIGEQEKAMGLFDEIIKKSKLAPKFYGKENLKWIELARAAVVQSP